MTFPILYIVAGLLLLIIGGELLIRGAVGLATILKLTPAVIGLTVVAAGTSVPELAVSAIAAWQNKTDISVGNVVGSNIFNIAAILGLVGIYRHLTLSGNTIRLEYPVLLAVTLLFLFLSWDGLIGRIEAVSFLLIYVAFTAYLIRVVRKQISAKEAQEFTEEVAELEPGSPGATPKISISTLLTVGGIALLGFGAELTVRGAVSLGQIFGMSERIIGLTIVGAGTGLPEIVTSLVSAYRGRSDVAIANVIGSNLFNILGILGISALLAPLHVNTGIITYDNWWMLGVTILLFPIMHSGMIISRREGAILMSVYLIYLVSLVLYPL